MMRFARIALLILCTGNGLRAQSAPTLQAPGLPEEGFVSRSKYTNAFFGFTLPFPQDIPLQGLSLPSRDPSRRFLFGLQSQRHGLTALTITAAQSGLASSEDAKKAASGPKGQSAKRIEISGKEFWKGESQNKGPAGKMRIVKYASALAGYVLEFNIVSFDSKLTDELEHSIESITFFDPAKAKEMAGADSQPYNPTVAPPRSSGGPVPQPSGRIKDLSPGTVSGNNYTNGALGLSYQFPAGWYVADKATQEKVIEAGHEAAWGNSPTAAREHEAAQKCMKILLWTNKYAEGTRTEDVNPLIVVSAADPDCFPNTKFPTSSDDQETIRQAAEALVRSFQGTPVVGQGSMKLGTLTAQGHLFLEVSGVSQVNVPGHPGPIELHNSMVFTSANNFWVIWMFSSGSEAGLQELKNTNITFSSSSTKP
jgi:hypothetical protein